jgi:ABC-type Fe3+ transport system substrate-binding protein
MLPRAFGKIRCYALFRGLLIVLAAASASCTPAAGPSTRPEGSAPAPVVSQEASVPGNLAWEAEWEKTLTAARREGRLVMSSVGSDAYRLPLISFEKDFPDIRVEYVGLSSPNFWTRVAQETAAGQHVWDLRVGGPDALAYDAKNQGLLAPVRPMFLLPDVVDDTCWLGGMDALYLDRESRFIPAFTASVVNLQYVNRDLIPDTELKSARELLDPKYRGRIALGDPRGGPGLGQLTLLLAGYGEEFVTDLLTKQAVVTTQDYRQHVEWVVRGRYPIGVGLAKDVMDEFKKEGLGLNVSPLEGPPGISNSAGGIQVFKDSPHPNAAKVYANWLFTQKTQDLLARSTGFNSRRRDVAPVDPAGTIDPGRLNEYTQYQSEQALPFRERAQQLATRLLP